MDNGEIQGVLFSEFPSQTPGNSDEVVGLHSGNNARFSIANIVAAIRQGLANLFVPTSSVGVADGVASLDSNGKVPSTQLPPISSDADDITYDPTSSGLSATNVQDAIDEVVTDLDSKQDTITASGILKGDGQGGVAAAVPGTDYQVPLTAGTDYATPAQLEGDAAKADLTSIQATGTTNTTGAAIPAGAYFYLNGVLHRAKTQIDVNATFTVNTNCEQVTEGGFNSLKAQTLVRRQTLATSITTGLNEWNVAADAVSGYKPVGIVGVQFAALPRSAVTLSQFLMDGTNINISVQSTQARTSGIAVNAFVLYAKE